MKYAAMMAALLLAGCATPGAVKVETVEVYRETMRPCPVTIPERPATVTADSLPPDARDALRLVVAALLAWQGAGGYGNRADAALRICAGE